MNKNDLELVTALRDLIGRVLNDLKLPGNTTLQDAIDEIRGSMYDVDAIDKAHNQTLVRLIATLIVLHQDSETETLRVLEDLYAALDKIVQGNEEK